MTSMIENKYSPEGKYIGTQEVIRPDAVMHKGNYYIPTNDQTKWVSTWEEFKSAGGQTSYEGDQTEIRLRLPEPYKFSIRFHEAA